MIEFRDASICIEHRTLIKDINLSIKEGELIFLVGNNGVGKSTLLNSAAGLIPVCGGEISIGGWKVLMKNDVRHKLCGYVLDLPMLIDSLSVYEYLLFVGSMRGIAKPELKRRIDALSELFDIALNRKPIYKLSKGQYQRCNLMAALLHSPKFLILDEPFTHMDIEFKKVIAEYLTRYVQENKATALIASHDLDAIHLLANKLWVIQDQRINELLDINSYLLEKRIAV